MEDFGQFIEGKKILVTGGTGSIGQVIVRQLLAFKPRVVRIFSRDTVKQIALAEDLKSDPRTRFIIGDLRDQERMVSACEDINIIFHAAAFKYVPQGEYNPFEAVQTNVIGTQNLLTAALKSPSVSHLVMISTDKAVAPTSTMGASKLLAERLVAATHYIKGNKDKIFASVRFGNVLGTTGSVIPIFREQAKQGVLNITHPEMTRFFMTIPDAVDLVFEAMMTAHGGETFVLKMPALRIKDLAEVCAERYANPKASVVVGSIRPGEKIHEALLTEDEARFAIETDRHFILIPQITIGDISADQYSYANSKPSVTASYKTSETTPLSHEEISTLLDRANL
jgi:UDP-N-acetylglucosamine 4,6-dehydratase/5-epimerase